MTHKLSLAFLASSMLVTACADSATGLSETENSDAAFARGGRPFQLGEQQPLVDVSRLLLLWPEDLGQNLAQTFSPPKNHLLGFLELPVGCFADVLLNVKIREGLEGPILYEVNIIDLPASPPPGEFQLLQVYDPAESRGIRLRKNLTYAFELASFPANPNVPSPNCFIYAGPTGDSYPRGQGFFEDAPINGAGVWLPLPNGLPTDSEDLPFRTLVR